MKYHITEESDKELGIVTVSVNELNIYGEGSTRNAAVNELLNSITELLNVYYEKYDLFSRIENPIKLEYYSFLFPYRDNREKLMEALGLEN
jgi:hypothetical protein